MHISIDACLKIRVWLFAGKSSDIFGTGAVESAPTNNRRRDPNAGSSIFGTNP
jgi:hypothetical protein